MNKTYWRKSAITETINGPSIWHRNGGVSCGHILVYTPIIPITRMGRAINSYIRRYKICRKL